ncbi:hypothetical protein SUGI_1114390 [Cryptomeria japonica]|uniref:uncharacterized protein LOC131060319 n=1 Tax=Cryptomeria japonica TaxID=3369 RepID=UPI0024149970|nr:uncharacterized protein LOC131060319 [Cryptomeria japonica]GLJ52390.1 hypothetical protein SUGI_1114390 [Cryptomeria japonica]
MGFGAELWVAVVAICLATVMMVSAAENESSYDAVQDYKMMPKSLRGRERALCFAKSSRCMLRILRCPAECPERKPKKARKYKGCMIDCSNKCETTCKYRKPNCKGYGAICYDPRFVGGDGVMFYFHGAKEKDFALLSDHHLQINAHFIGTKPEGRKRPYTWVQALGIMFGSHTFTIASKEASTWDESLDHFIFTFDGKAFTIPEEALVEWTPPSLGPIAMKIERIDEANNVNIVVPGIVEIFVSVVPILEKENLMHNYQLPIDNVFAHLEMQFKFFNLSSEVEGILGQTYRPGFNNPVKRGVPMPIMGGEDKYATSSLLSTDCNYCKYSSASSFEGFNVNGIKALSAECTSGDNNGGMVCRR